jgi:dihydrofolate reductase
MRISLVAALARNRVIGRDGQLPWRLPADLKRFKRLTVGHPLILGRKTYESIGRPLPERTNIVITRREGYAPAGIRLVRSIDEALAAAAEAPGADEAFVIGGSEIYRQTLPIADRLHLTFIEEDFPGDVHFPELDETQWRLVDEERHEASEDTPFAWSYRTYDRIR